MYSVMEIKFKRDTSFRKQFFVPDSFAHPAKMDAQLLIWIVEHYTEAGETILDPMAGSGTTMLACTLGRNCILVELEEKFCKMMRDNWEQVKMRPQLGSTMGTCQIIRGDARQLEGLLVDKIVSSPPYSDISMGGGLNTKPPREGTKDQSGRSSDSPSQKGLVDKIVTSPPYAEAVHSTGQSAEKVKKLGSKYSNGSQAVSMEHGYSEDPNNLGNLPYGQIDKIVTSPPYEGSIDRGNENFEDVKLHQAGMSRKELLAIRRDAQLGYGETTNNIGNLKSQSYLEAMLQVYQQCHKVLKPEGLMILVTKNFIRNKQVIRLDLDTIKLCEQAGFSFVERHYRELPSQSFWRVIYHQKFPDVEQIKSEDILVFRK